jgi:hypothetical protein
MLQTFRWTVGASAIGAFILTLLLEVVLLPFGAGYTGGGFLQVWATIGLGLLVIFLILQGIFALISMALDRMYQASHAGYLKDLREQGLTEAQIQDKLDDPGFVARHMGVLGIGALILAVCLFPISLPLAGIYGLHLLWGWRSAKEDVQSYDARFQSSAGGPGRRAP